MELQADLFSDATTREMVELEAETRQPMAAPCAWRNAANKPCRRLAHEPVLMDGEQFFYRGHPMLHCLSECFRVATSPATEIDYGV